MMELLSTIIGPYYGTDWFGMTLMCISIYLLGIQNRWGFIVGIGSCIGWFFFGLLVGSIPDIVAQVIISVMHIQGFRKWHDTQEQEAYIPEWLVPHKRIVFPFPSL